MQSTTRPQPNRDDRSAGWPRPPTNGDLPWALRAAVPRPRLRERIDRGVRGKLTLLSAPPGWGKTTLLGEWATGAEMPVAWVPLEPADDVPLRFWRRVVTALDHACPGIADDALALLNTAQSPPLAQVIAAALDAAAWLPWDASLVLEDLHHIHSPEIYETLARFIDAMPPTLHLIVATRHDPPLRLSRLRAQGDLVELRTPDLRFDLAEAERFFAAAPGVDLAEEEIAAIVEKTEGWIAGLRLATLSLEDRADPGGFIAGFGGAHRDVADYLGEEILARQPESVSRFLLQTSIVDRLTASLCNALTGDADGQEMLEHLEQRNLFLLPLDDTRTWYRYHGLFADLLRVHLRRAFPNHETTLHGRAAAWYEAQGQPFAAVQHAILAADPNEAAAMLERAADRLLWSSGEVSTFLRWVETLPAAVRDRRPRLMCSHAWGLTLAGRIDDAETAVSEIERRLESEYPEENDAPSVDLDSINGRDVLRGETMAIRSRIAAARSDHATAAHFAEQSLGLVPRSHGRLRGDVALNLGYACLVLGRLREATAAFDEGIDTGWSSGNTRAALFSLFYLAQTRLAEGRLREARSLFADELDRLERGGPDTDAGPSAAILRFGLGEILYEQNDLAAARHHLEQAVAVGRRSGDAKTLIYSYLPLARVYQALGESELATATIRRAVRLSVGPWTSMEQARLALIQGELRTAERFVADAAIDFTTEPVPTDETHYATFARYLVAQGRPAGAIPILERRLTAAEVGGRPGRALSFLSLLALAHHTIDNHPAAYATLTRALALAAPEGYVRTFVDLGAPFADLLRDALQAARRSADLASTLPIAYAQSLLAALAAPTAGHPGPSANSGLIEPLSDREIQILALVAAGRSNQEVAAELYLALGTIKAHLNHIYTKLLARNRTEAVTTARRLTLIP